MIWNLKCFLARNLIAMNTTVSRMIVDAQETLAVRKLAFPVLRRSLQCFCHRDSYQAEPPNKENT